MKRFFFWCLFALPFTVNAQHNSIGIRIGEPFALTYKRYLPENKALEFMIGTAPNFFSNTYYKKSFRLKYDDLSYVDHQTSDVFYTAGRYVFHFQVPTEGIEGKLDWYVGFGAIFKTAHVEYEYKDFDISGRETFVFSKTDFDFGPEGVAGLEFTMQNAPIVILAEMSCFFEVSNRAAFRVLPGLGLRYTF
jgi:hypothetical protein